MTSFLQVNDTDIVLQANSCVKVKNRETRFDKQTSIKMINHDK